MCDTFIIPPELSETGNRILAKNSDREPNEAQHLIYYPRKAVTAARVNTNFCQVEHVDESFATILSKPFHLWGAEMGVNEYKVAIGNEALFTRIPSARKNTGLTGMDMIRLALERSKSAREALHNICHYVETHGQDACGGYLNRNFFYDNSFLISDPYETFILETAGRFWVWRKISGFYAISNRLTITNEWEDISEGAIDFARKKGWSKKGMDFSFADAFTSPLMSNLAKASARRNKCLTLASGLSASGKMGIREAMAILRSHNTQYHFEPSKGAMDCLCLHATGILTPSQTTGSMVAELDALVSCPVWFTGSSAPCLSLFKPFYTDLPIPDQNYLPTPDSRTDMSYWWQWEEWHRSAILKYPAAKRIMDALAGNTEDTWRKKAEILQVQKAGTAERSAFSQDSMALSLDILHELKKHLLKEKKKSLNWIYGRNWRKWNRMAGITIN